MSAGEFVGALFLAFALGWMTAYGIKSFRRILDAF
jgi:hypothetical protein